MEQTDGKAPEEARAADEKWWHGYESLSRRRLRIWLYTGAALTFIILIIGGTTRLTRSGLSMVEWRPIVGVLPPLGEVQWQAAFDQYRQFPEYRKLRQGMTLSEYKSIYLWEYAHRMAARTVGLVFLLPFIFFWVRGYLNRPLFRRLLILFALGALQGGMGWFMVKSGLVIEFSGCLQFAFLFGLFRHLFLLPGCSEPLLADHAGMFHSFAGAFDICPFETPFNKHHVPKRKYIMNFKKFFEYPLMPFSFYHNFNPL